MKKILFFIVSITSVLYLNAQETDNLLEKANSLFIDGKYQEASETYENILKLGYESSDLYYNLGNAYYKQNVISQSILNYEKALLLAPNDDDIKYNLELCNRLVIDQIETLPVFFITGWIQKLKNLFSSDLWAAISIVLFTLALTFISFYFYSKGISFKKLSFWLGFVLAVFSSISFVFSNQQKNTIISGKTAIVLSPSVTVKSSPDASGTDLFVIHEGTKVSIDDNISEWSEIKLSDGSKGWIKLEDLGII
jgi:hypothetical protein